MTNVESFNEKGYTQINGFIDKTTVEIISQYMENTIRLGLWKEVRAPNEPTLFSYYADPLTEVLLVKCKDAVEHAIGRELLPTYSYSRVYQSGEELPVHTDREACEISVTVNVASRGEVSPFYTKYKDSEITEHKLNPGDAIVYMGCEVEHGRKPLEEGQLNVQFMLHYVDKNGPYKAFEKDTRPVIGSSHNEKRIK